MCWLIRITGTIETLSDWCKDLQKRWVHRIVTPNLKATPGTNSYENTRAYFCKFSFSVKWLALFENRSNLNRKIFPPIYIHFLNLKNVRFL